MGSHCNAIKTGTESYGSFKNIHIHHCTIVPTKCDKVYYGKPRGQSALCITNVDGAELEDIHIHDIEITSGTDIPIFLRLGARLRPYENAAPKPVGTYRGVTLERITSRESLNSGYACAIVGVTAGGRTYDLQDIALRDIALHFTGEAESGKDAITGNRVPEKADAYPHPYILGDLPAYGIYCRHVSGLQLRNIRLSCDGGERRPPIVHEDVHGLTLDGIGAWYHPDHCSGAVLEVGATEDRG